MLTERLYCRPLATANRSYDELAAAAYAFAAPEAVMDSSSGGMVAWREDIGFLDLDPRPGPPAEPVTVQARIGFLALEGAPEGGALVGVVASFSSLAAAARHWLAEREGLTLQPPDADLRAVLDAADAVGRIASVSVTTDLQLVTVIAGGGRSVADRLPKDGRIRSIGLRGPLGDMELNEALDLSLPDPGPDGWSVAADEIREVYVLVAAGRPASMTSLA